MRFSPAFLAGTALLALAACSQKSKTPDAPPAPPAIHAEAVDGAVIKAADDQPGVWLSHGRTYSEQRYSPLAKITKDNVAQLGLAWSEELDTDRGMESTPIVADGVMYVTSGWSVAYALDAKTGKRLWKYDPGVDRSRGVSACCDVVNRGVALWKGKIFLGTIDGRLIALDAKTGKPVWEKVTVDQSRPYTITGAPRVIKGKVMIGNGGAELGVRGYVSAYDAETGEMAWRFYTTPNPNKKPDNAASDKAFADFGNKTWDDKGAWTQTGGGGTAWDAITYDPDLDIVYFGIGNGSPWNRELRSPKGGDNLFLSSILALKPDTGEYVWHYQTTPGESWDYTATQPIILADIEIGGAKQKVLMQAPKNGFFYVLDRANGKLLSADKFQDINWATGFDEKTGRPIEAKNARYLKEPVLTYPGPLGSHNWQPMSFSPQTGLVYIPAHTLPAVYAKDQKFKYRPGFWNTGTDSLPGALPNKLEERKATMAGLKMGGQLVAWDPVARKPRWTVNHASPWNGGILSTAGGLVFQGGLAGRLAAYDAATGDKKWETDGQYPMESGPISYEVDGEQYIAATAGWGSVIPLLGDWALPKVGAPYNGRVLVFKVGGTAKLPADKAIDLEKIARAAKFGTPAQIAHGKDLYYRNCMVCHGEAAASGGVTPDLRFALGTATKANFAKIVLDGAYSKAGMVSFAKTLSPSDAEDVRAYLVSRGNEDAAPAAPAAATPDAKAAKPAKPAGK